MAEQEPSRLDRAIAPVVVVIWFAVFAMGYIGGVPLTNLLIGMGGTGAVLLGIYRLTTMMVRAVAFEGEV